MRNEDDIHSALEKLKTNIKHDAYEALGTRTVKDNSRLNIAQWFCSEIKPNSTEKERAYPTYRNLRTPESHGMYKSNNQQKVTIRKLFQS